MITASALLEKHPQPGDEQIGQPTAGNRAGRRQEKVPAKADVVLRVRAELIHLGAPAMPVLFACRKPGRYPYSIEITASSVARSFFTVIVTFPYNPSGTMKFTWLGLR